MLILSHPLLKISLLLCLLTLSLIQPINIPVKATSLPGISLIIDDVGSNRMLGLRAARLPPEVALSILPHTPFSQEIAALGHQRGMDILLHQPMESINSIDLLGPGALLDNMEQQEFARILDDNINAVPHVIGINNHMGSLLTSNQEKMNWLMAELKPRAIFFIDSRTSTSTVAAITAKRWQIPTMSRKVFLDHYDEPEAIAEQFQRLLSLAEKHGHATAIAHPRKNTLLFLEQNLPQLKAAGFKLVSPSEAIYTHSLQKVNNNQQAVSVKLADSYDNCYKSDLKRRFNIPLQYSLDSLINCSDY